MHEISQSEHGLAQPGFWPPSIRLRKALWVSLFLACSTFVTDYLVSRHLDSLVFHHEIGKWNRYTGLVDIGAALFLIFQTVLVTASFFWGRVKIDAGTLVGALRVQKKELLLGAAGGAAAYVVSLPLLLSFDSDSQFVESFLTNPYSAQTILLAILLLVVVPLTAEVAFRAIIFKTLQEELNVIAATTISVGLFAYVWPIFNGGTAFLLGLTNTWLYYRSGKISPGVVASAVLILLAAVTLILKAL